MFDTEGKPLRNTLVEIWQANACGPLPPRVGSLPGAARSELLRRRPLPDRRRRALPLHHDQAGPYPWGNHYNAWRPAHIHFSLLGRAFAQRLVTQMYFPGDPLFPYDPIFNSVPDERARERLISRFSIHETQPDWALGYELDIYLRGPGATPFEEAAVIFGTTPSQTVGPYFAIGLPWAVGPAGRRRRHARRVHDLAARSSTAPATPIPDYLLETWQADPDGRFADPCGLRRSRRTLEGFRGFGALRPSRTATAASSS